MRLTVAAVKLWSPITQCLHVLLPNRRRERERERGRWIMDGSGVKKRPKVRWLFVINPRERKKEGRKEPQEKADGQKERGREGRLTSSAPSLSPDLNLI